MREQHRLGIGWHSWLPKHRRVEPGRVDVQQDQILTTAVEPVGGQVHLPGSRQVDELTTAGIARADTAAPAGLIPLLGSAQVHQDIGGEGHISTP
ncbi:hypothetical protein A5625_17080 [Mycobacterium sp. 1465703.0]|nr:hypothetical protein A5625_17080 [Mycobacterium sp. 1465703.0]